MAHITIPLYLKGKQEVSLENTTRLYKDKLQ